MPAIALNLTASVFYYTLFTCLLHLMLVGRSSHTLDRAFLSL